MPELVYSLCVVTSFACTVLLLRGFRRSRARLLLWSALCFLGLAIGDSILLLYTLALVPGLEIVRGIVSLAGISFLIYGLIFDTE
jgi:hypothetical protein